MQYCGNCGTEVIEGSSFCNNCGAAIPDLTKIRQPTQIPITLSAVNIITQGIEILKAIPKILWIVVAIGILDIIVYYLLSFIFGSKITVISENIYTEIMNMNFSALEALLIELIPYAIVSIILSVIIGLIFTAWTLTTYKKFHLNPKISEGDLLSKAFFDSFPYILKLFVQRIIFAGIMILAVTIPIFVMMFFIIMTYPSSGSDPDAAMSTLGLILLFLIVIIVILLYIIIKYNYIEQALILDDVGVIESFSRSSQFTKKYFCSSF